MSSKNNTSYPQRKSIRYQGYDYSSDGVYFVTLVTHKWKHLFGSIVNGVMKLNDFGVIVKEEWFKSASIREEIELDLDEFIIMPNHVHGIVQINGNNLITNEPDCADEMVRAYGHTPVPTSFLKSPSMTLGSMIRSFKCSVTTRINTIRKSPGEPVWLRNYYDHIIQTEKEYFNISNYIHDNPENWEAKEEFFSKDLE